LVSALAGASSARPAPELGGGTSAVPEAAAGDESLGFNSARQMVKTGESKLAIVWVDARGTQLVIGERSLGSSALSRIVLASGTRIQTPALTVHGRTLAVAWVEGGSVYARVRIDGRWLPEERLGAGAAPSLAAARGYLGIAWHSRDAEKVFFSRRAVSPSADWSEPAELARAGAGAVSFASVAGSGQSFVAVWKRGGRSAWKIELSRSDDLGRNWATARTIGAGADPAVCLRGANDVWVGHQTTRGAVFLLHSTDGGRTFASYEVGNGWFAHVSCTTGGVAVAWEQTAYPPMHPDTGVKSFGLAFVSAGGKVTPLPEPATAHVVAPSILAFGTRAAVAWIDTSASSGLIGTLVTDDVSLAR
jgi:hypothetical protein